MMIVFNHFNLKNEYINDKNWSKYNVTYCMYECKILNGFVSNLILFIHGRLIANYAEPLQWEPDY